MKLTDKYIIPAILPADEMVLRNDIYLIILHASRIPPHLALSVKGVVFTLTIKGATVDGSLDSLLKVIRKRSIEAVFVRLSMPALFTIDQLKDEIRRFMFAYPRVDIDIATCLSPIKDFCGSVYEPEMRDVNFVYELLPQLYEKNIADVCYQINMDKKLSGDNYYMEKYSLFEIHERIRNEQTISVL